MKIERFIQIERKKSKKEREKNMAQVMVNFRMEEELKKEMEEVCKELGLSITAAFTIFAKKMTREKRIPFEVSVDPLHTERSLAYMKAILEKYEELEKAAEAKETDK